MLFPDLDTATVSDKELNNLAFDPSAYPIIQDMLTSREFNSQEFQTIDLTALSLNGVIKRDTSDEYHSKKKYVTSTGLKEMLKTPLHFLWYQEQKFKKEKKDAFELGTFAHMAFIEPERFDKFIIEPDEPLNSKDGVLKLIRFYEKTNGMELSGVSYLGPDPKFPDLKNYLANLKSQCPYDVVPKDTQEIIDALSFSYKHYGAGIIKRIMKGAIGETSFYTADPDTGIPVSIRPDAINIKENIGVDAIISFKTTSAGTLGKFLYDTAKYKYELSEGMYSEIASHVTGRQFNTTIMIMLQTVPPYLPAVFWWNAEDLANGKYKYHSAMETVAQCRESGLYPGFDVFAESGHYGIIDLAQPEWAKKELHPVDLED